LLFSYTLDELIALIPAK